MAQHRSLLVLAVCLMLIVLLAGLSDGLHVIGGMAVGTAVGVVLVLFYGYWRKHRAAR